MKILLFQTIPDILAWCWHLALYADLLLAPLALWRRARKFVGSVLFGTSFIFGASLWYISAILTFSLWGTLALVVGLLIVGLGVVPMAIVATALQGIGGEAKWWGIFLTLLLVLGLTFGARISGLYLIDTD